MDHYTAKWQRLSKSDPENLEFQMAAVKARARVDGPKVLLQPLVDFQFWADVATWRRDMAISAVRQLLGEAFAFDALHTFECASESHGIARFIHKRTGIELHLIPGGCFQMGSEDFEQEQPIHQVTISPFLLGRFPVRQSEWDLLGGNDDRLFHGDDLPIDTLSWHDADHWLKELGDGFRMPSEAEWEYACRANTQTDFFWGENYMSETMERFRDYSHIWFGLNSKEQSQAPASHAEHGNGFGLVDMAGNVNEWCADCWIGNYESGPTNQAHRSLAESAPKVLRGGGWSVGGAELRSANRSCCEPWRRRREAGLRVALNLPGWTSWR
jgi:formylglycine-generating enzyme required for sulfatase activity